MTSRFLFPFSSRQNEESIYLQFLVSRVMLGGDVPVSCNSVTTTTTTRSKFERL